MSHTDAKVRNSTQGVDQNFHDLRGAVRSLCQRPRPGNWHGCRVVEREGLQGGVANAGSVVREGDFVLRPANPHTEAVHALFRYVRAAGFDGVPEPVGIDPDGRERLVFIPGDVAVPPFPAWSQTDQALASVAELLARFHDAAGGFETPVSLASLMGPFCRQSHGTGSGVDQCGAVMMTGASAAVKHAGHDESPPGRHA